MVNFTKCCRLCLKDDELLQKFNSKDIAELCSKIHQHFDVLISVTDKLSTKICQECASKVYDFAVFYNIIQHNQEQLKLCMEIQNKIPELKQEDDCVIIKMETDHLAFVPNSENRMISVDYNESMNSTRKRSADDTPTNSKNYDTKRIRSTINNIQSTNNNIAATQNSLNTKVDKVALITNEVVKPNKIRVLKLSDSNKNLLKQYKCKKLFVKLKRLSTLENKLNKITDLTDKTLNLNNIKRITVQQIKGKGSNELIVDNTAHCKTLKQYNETYQKNSSKQKIFAKKCLLTSNDETNNKQSMELKNTGSSAILNNILYNNSTNNKNTPIKVIRTSNSINTDCGQILENNMKFTNLTKNKIKMPAIIQPMSTQKENSEKDTVYSANKLHIMNSSQLTEQNIQISTCSTLSTKSAESPQMKIIQPKISIVKKPIINNIVKRTIINSISELPQNVLTPAAISKAPIKNTSKATAELCTRYLFPAKLLKGQSLTEQFYLQNQIQNSNIGNNKSQNLPKISTSSMVAVAPITSQAAATSMLTTIQSQHLNTNTSFTTITPRKHEISYLAEHNKVSETLGLGEMIPSVHSTSANRIDTVIMKNLQTINTVQKLHSTQNNLNNQQQLQRNNFQNRFKQSLQLHEPITQPTKSKMSYCENKNIINKQSVQQQLNLQINKNNEVQIQEYNNQQQMQHNCQPENQSPYPLNKINQSTERVKILTVSELNQKATTTTSFSKIPSYSSIQPISQHQPISKNNLSSITIDSTLPIQHAENSIHHGVCVNILVNSINKNQITIKLNNLATGKLCYYWELSEQQKGAVKQTISSIDKEDVKRLKPYQLDDYAKNLLERINFSEFRKNFAL